MDYLIGVLVIVGLLFPVAYAFTQKLNNKLLFIFSAYGAQVVIGTLLFPAALPFIVLDIYILPQADAYADTHGVSLAPLNIIFNIVENYWYVIEPVAVVIMSVLIHRRYGAFFESKTNT